MYGKARISGSAFILCDRRSRTKAFSLTPSCLAVFFSCAISSMSSLKAMVADFRLFISIALQHYANVEFKCFFQLHRWRALIITEKTKVNRRKRIFILSVLGVTSLVIVSFSLILVSPSRSAQASVQSLTYTVNGLTCPFAPGTPSYVSSLVQRTTQSSEFISGTGGMPYRLMDFGNWTDHVVTTGHVTTVAAAPGNRTGGFKYVGPVTTLNLPDGTALGFATWGSTTSCSEEGNSWIHWLDVQVPVQNGQYNFSNETVHIHGGHK